jgi:hypothetical protein
MNVGLSPSYLNATKYTGDQFADVPCVSVGRAPTPTDINYPLLTLWINSNKQAVAPDSFGDLWYLAYFIPQNGLTILANWIKLGLGAGGPVISINLPNPISPIAPDITGNLNFTSTGGTIAITGTSAFPNNHTVNFDLTGGSIGVDSFQVQAVTAPGVNPVVPDGAGLVNINATTVANHSVPIETRTRALNTFNVEAQFATSAAATDATKNGLAHYDSSQFTVDANGFVQLASTVQQFTWQRINANQSLVKSNGYMVYGNALTLPLPAVSVIGDTIEVVLDGGTSWTITQPNAGSQIRYGNVETTLGVGGSISSNFQGDYLRLVCQTANGRWNAFSSSVLNVT